MKTQYSVKSLKGDEGIIFLFVFAFQDPDKPGDKPRMQEYQVDLNKYVTS